MLENNEEKNSVVIKVGMVGDSQIGKTSLMVKYVEGSFDEDYIQTLGEDPLSLALRFAILMLDHRCQLHGENDFCPAYHHHVLNMGFGWPARVCQYAAARL
jgi:hypothetical protein